ncbi:MAG: CoB--CoM heterodisulfide reductase iron-sulfur subunit B family protein [Desulfobacterales bacterium]|nr:CoB--CoM heterodisulfide reductase iron-sulfur subunit B family protein [Desulfobacterales bacterium]MDD3081679.1 CoB--CoM heterodisulfide reductase iron-sulfur subunit B family protein [Desulfobacterales bacterium]MDD3950656.1 CoB--CoM heterodisulfide reductase iron-sulfur subunit B family protein [Desulfobacterales bacterium]MDD4462737.1 CoB--CoM heterodisulfide reductase iron-sulfur subunit B family protein [Desulfobacterales bacterium]MDY0377004.1 CoB--CoM heterodisulfide reductase iron-
MLKRVAYYPGCSCEGMAIEYDQSVRALCYVLGIELVGIPDWNCCGSTPSHSYDPLLGAALAGRNLAIAKSQGLDVVMTPCPSCLKALKTANQVFRERPSEFLDVLGMPFSGDVRAISVLQLLYEEIGPNLIQKAVKFPFKNKKIVPYYGCLLTRPPAFAQFDDPENPVSMDRLIEAAGAAVPDFPHKTECCGAALGITQRDVVMRLTGRILEMARAVGADAVAVACPLCQQNLDLRQDQVNRALKENFNLPVLYITQIIGCALGIDRKTLGIEKLAVKTDALFQSA